MHKTALRKNVRVDDWTTERAIIASNVKYLKITFVRKNTD